MWRGDGAARLRFLEGRAGHCLQGCDWPLFCPGPAVAGNLPREELKHQPTAWWPERALLTKPASGAGVTAVRPLARWMEVIERASSSAGRAGAAEGAA